MTGGGARRVAALTALALTGQAAPPAFSDGVKRGFDAVNAGRYFAAREAFAAAAFDPAGKVRDEGAFQIWAQFGPMIDGELPVDAFLRRPTAPPPDATWAERVRGASARSAIDEIVRRARATSIVILNEAHYSPRDRAFALEVARALRPLGYATLAAETFSNDAEPGKPIAIDRLARDGFARFGTGAYSKDPVFAGYVRAAMAIGYRPVAYEITDAQAAKGSDVATREQAQVANLMQAVFARDPAAKVLLHVGHSHVAEAAIPGGRGPTEWMAARLKRATGIDPLTIDQTTLTDLSPQARAAYPLAAAKVGRADGVLFADGRPLVLGPYAGAVDLQVVHPARSYAHGRPAWLAALGGRPVAVPSALLPATGERLIQAFAADAPADAVPLDQVLVAAGRPAPRLMLPRVKVRYATQP